MGNTTEFLRTLELPDVSSPAFKLAQNFMSIKGYPTPDVLGVFREDDVQFFYYRLPEGVLEVEVRPDTKTRALVRRVSDFITSPAEVQEMLGI